MALPKVAKVFLINCYIDGGKELGQSGNDYDLYVRMPNNWTPSVINRGQYQTDEEYQRAKEEVRAFWEQLADIRAEVLESFVDTAILRRIREVMNIDVTKDVE